MRVAAAALALCLSAPVIAQDTPPPPEYRPLPGAASLPLSEAVQVGDVLYLSGNLGIAQSGRGLVEGGIGPETHRTMERIGETLAAYGLTHDDLFKCTVMLADIAEFRAFNTAYATYFTGPDYPSRSAFGGVDLVGGARVELECWAWNPRGASREAKAMAGDAGALARLLAGRFEGRDSAGNVDLADFRAAIPPLGEGEWLYFQREQDGAVYRQRVIQLLPQGDGSVAQVTWTLGDPAQFADALRNPAILASLDAGDLTEGRAPDCPFTWTRDADGNGWRGLVDPAACVISSQRRSERIRIGAESRLTVHALAEAERGFALDGALLWGTPEGDFARLERVD